jgi:hypothetical protein
MFTQKANGKIWLTVVVVLWIGIFLAALNPVFAQVQHFTINGDVVKLRVLSQTEDMPIYQYNEGEPLIILR